MKKKNSKINFQLFPQTQKPTEVMNNVIEVFRNNQDKIDSTKNTWDSNKVLELLSDDLKRIGFDVEKDKKNKLKFGVLYGLNGKVLKSFDVDAFHSGEKIILEIEAGRGLANNQFLKDFFEACVIPDAENLIIAVRNIYKDSNDFEKVINYFETLYASKRLKVPLKRLLIIGY